MNEAKDITKSFCIGWNLRFTAKSQAYIGREFEVSRQYIYNFKTDHGITRKKLKKRAVKPSNPIVYNDINKPIDDQNVNVNGVNNVNIPINTHVFDKLELTDIENAIRDKLAAYERNITSYKNRHKIVSNTDPALLKCKNYREKLRYIPLLKKIREMIKK